MANRPGWTGLFLAQRSVFPNDSVMAVANRQAALSKGCSFLLSFEGSVKYFF